MDNSKMPVPGQIYKHFKNKLYQIITVATHTETGEKMVVYQALYGDFKTYVRPLEMFLSEVDHMKYPEIMQKFRFELVSLNDIRVDDSNVNDASVDEKISVQAVSSEKEIKNDNLTQVNYESNVMSQDIKTNKVKEIDPLEQIEGQVHPVLMEFLEANSYDEKLAIVMSRKKYIDDKLLNYMAVSLDCTVEDGPIDERISGFIFCLQTLARFENRRLR
jgi:hypothetical protein